jgi:hypothetical protein
MRKATTTLLFAAFWIFPVSFSNAQVADKTFSAADLKSVCTDSASQICSAYIAGYSQGFYYSTVSSQTGFTPCLTQNLPEPKARLITTRFLNDHPEVMGQGAASVVAEALVSAFPCGSSR